MIRDPRTGTAILLVAAALSLPPLAQAVCVALAWVLPFLQPKIFMPATVQRRAAWYRFQPFSALFILASVFIQGMFAPEPDIHLAFATFSSAGMITGLEISLRAILILTGIFLLFMPMQPLELAAWLTRAHLPIGIPVAILLSLQLVEDLPETIRRIRRAQRSRGLNLDGSFLHRLRSVQYLITPLVMRSLEGSLERATALQLRGLLHPSEQTFAKPRGSSIGTALAGLGIVLIIIRLCQWIGLLPSIG